MPPKESERVILVQQFTTKDYGIASKLDLYERKDPATLTLKAVPKEDFQKFTN